MKKLFYIVLVIVVLLVIAQFVKQESAAPVPAEDVAVVVEEGSVAPDTMGDGEVVEEATSSPDMMGDGQVVEEEAEEVIEVNPEETAGEDETVVQE